MILIVCGCDSMTKSKYYNSGQTAFENREYNNAIEYYNSGLRVDNSDYLDSELRYGRAYSYFRLRQYDDAKIDLFKAINKNKNDYLSHWLLAKLYEAQNQNQFSLDNYTRAIEINPSPLILSSRGFLLIELRRYSEAIIDFDRAIELDSNTAYAYNNRALANIKLGFFDKAKQDLRLSKRYGPDNPYYFKHLAYYMISNNDIDSVCYILNQAEEFGYDNLSSAYDRGDIDSLKNIYCD